MSDILALVGLDGTFVLRAEIFQRESRYGSLIQAVTRPKKPIHKVETNYNEETYREAFQRRGRRKVGKLQQRFGWLVATNQDARAYCLTAVNALQWSDHETVYRLAEILEEHTKIALCGRNAVNLM